MLGLIIARDRSHTVYGELAGTSPTADHHGGSMYSKLLYVAYMETVY